MSEAAKVKYGDFQFGLSDEFPIPLVSISNEYLDAGERWGILNSFTLNGEIVACSKATLVDKQNELISAFSEDFKTLEVSGIDNVTLAKVVSIDFEPSDYLSAVVYSISLEAYDFNTFKSEYGVIDPVDSVSMTEESNKTLTITHTISAKGVNTGSYNALTNAKNFVQAQLNSQKSAGTWPVPNLINSEDPNFKRMLVSVSEDINRIDGSYGITKTYRSDLTSKQGNIILRYTKQTQEQEGQFETFSFNGTVEGGIDSSLDFEDLRERLRDFKRSLNTEFVNELVDDLSIEEDIEAGVITFTMGFSSSPLELIDDFSVQISENSDSALISVSVNGTISAKGPIGSIGGADCRYEMVLDSFNENKYYDIATEEYLDYLNRRSITVPSDVILNEKHLSKNITHNKFEGSITYSFNYNDRISHGYRNFDYTMSFTPSLQAISASDIVDGGNAFYDLGYRTRASFEINGSAVGNGEDLPVIAERKYREFCGGQGAQKIFTDEVVERQSLTEDQENNFTFDNQWTFHSPNFVIDPAESYTIPLTGESSLIL